MGPPQSVDQLAEILVRRQKNPLGGCRPSQHVIIGFARSRIAGGFHIVSVGSQPGNNLSRHALVGEDVQADFRASG